MNNGILLCARVCVYVCEVHSRIWVREVWGGGWGDRRSQSRPDCAALLVVRYSGILFQTRIGAKEEKDEEEEEEEEVSARRATEQEEEEEEVSGEKAS